MKNSLKVGMQKIPSQIVGLIVLVIVAISVSPLAMVYGPKQPPDFYTATITISPTINGVLLQDSVLCAVSVEKKDAGAYKVGDKIPCGLYKMVGYIGMYGWSAMYTHTPTEKYYAVDTGTIITLKESWNSVDID